jgi:hypothetical protein
MEDEGRKVVIYDQMALRLAFAVIGRERLGLGCPSCRFREATPGTGAYSFDLEGANGGGDLYSRLCSKRGCTSGFCECVYPLGRSCY